jgi:uncharacterized membrane protein
MGWMDNTLVGPSNELTMHHSRFIKRGARFSSEVVDAFATWGCVILVIAIIGLLFAAWPVDSAGRQPHDHLGPVPAKVQQLSSDQYIIPAGMSPGTICFGTDQEGNSTSKVTNVNKFNIQIVECSLDQKWNTGGEKASVDYGHALGIVAMSPVYLLLLGAALFVWFQTWVWMAISDFRAVGRAKKKVKLSIEQRREMLTTAWAKGDVDDEAFNKKLDQLVAEEEDL